MERVSTLLELAIKEATKLSLKDQEAFAAWMLEELDEQRWQKRFAETLPELRKLADEAHREYLAGETEELDPDTL